MLLTILDGAIGLALGPECQMTADEHGMIDEPLARIMARLTPDVSEAVSKWTDPLLLAFGFALYGARVFAILQRRAAEEKPKPHLSTQPDQTFTPSPNGSDMATGIPVEVAELLG